MSDSNQSPTEERGQPSTVTVDLERVFKLVEGRLRSAANGLKNRRDHPSFGYTTGVGAGAWTGDVPPRLRELTDRRLRLQRDLRDSR